MLRVVAGKVENHWLRGRRLLVEERSQTRHSPGTAPLPLREVDSPAIPSPTSESTLTFPVQVEEGEGRRVIGDGPED